MSCQSGATAVRYQSAASRGAFGKVGRTADGSFSPKLGYLLKGAAETDMRENGIVVEGEHVVLRRGRGVVVVLE